MTNFDDAFDLLIGNEGGDVNDPKDTGGETMWGVTKTVARANGYTGDMKDLSKDTAKAIYRKNYWDAHLDFLPFSLAFNIFDMAVNSGVHAANIVMQRVVGVTDDGAWGVGTDKSVRAFIAKHGADIAAYTFIIERAFYFTTCKTFPSFRDGWRNRLANNAAKVRK